MCRRRQGRGALAVSVLGAAAFGCVERVGRLFAAGLRTLLIRREGGGRRLRGNVLREVREIGGEIIIIYILNAVAHAAHRVRHLSRHCGGVLRGGVYHALKHLYLPRERGGVLQKQVRLHLPDDAGDVLSPVNRAAVFTGVYIPALTPGDAADVVAVMRVADFTVVSALGDDAA